jgi:hypothetical protein
MKADLERYLSKTYRVIMGKELELRPHLSEHGSVESLLQEFSDIWYEQSKEYPVKRANNATYTERAKYWVRGGELHTLILPTTDKTRGTGVRYAHLTDIRFNQKSIRATATFAGGEVKKDFGVDLSAIVPLFDGYTRDFTSMLKFLKEVETRQIKFQPVPLEQRDFSQEQECDWMDNTKNTNTKNTNTQTNYTKETNTMGKIQSAAANVVTTTKNSFSLAAGITAGNATNAIVKAALRPVLEPALRKMLQPKGFVQRTLGKNKVEDSVTTIMESPLMDLVSAMLLVSITSSGLVTNEKLVKGSSLASDAAMVKLSNLIDFDTVLSGITAKVVNVVSSLEGTELPK